MNYYEEPNPPKIGDCVRIDDVTEAIITHVEPEFIVVQRPDGLFQTFMMDEVEHRRLDA